MDKDLTKKLKWCKRELASLKIAHEQSVGEVNFYSATKQATVTLNLMSYVIIEVNYNKGMEQSPACQIYLDMPQYFSSSSMSFVPGYNSSYNKLKLSSYWGVFGTTITLNVKAISSAEISSINIRTGLS